MYVCLYIVSDARNHWVEWDLLGKRRVSALAPPSGQIAAPATAHAHADSCNVGGNSGPPKRRSQRAPNECTPNCCTSIDSRSAQPVGGTSTYSLIHQNEYPIPMPSLRSSLLLSVLCVASYLFAMQSRIRRRIVDSLNWLRFFVSIA